MKRYLFPLFVIFLIFNISCGEDKINVKQENGESDSGSGITDIDYFDSEADDEAGELDENTETSSDDDHRIDIELDEDFEDINMDEDSVVENHGDIDTDDFGNTGDTADTGDTASDADVTSVCGNGVSESGEICERHETKPCEDLGDNWFPINEAVCNTTCSGWDTYSCVDINDPTCYQVYQCVEDCEDSVCEEGCLQNANTGARSKYDTMMDCYETYCPDRNEDCINEKCKFQTDACKTHMTCGNGTIDQYEICESPETIDCGEIKDGSGEAIYEAGTANAFCNPNCTEWNGMMCYKFCSCSAIKTCVADECGGYETGTSECVKDCEDQGSHEGKNQHKAWRTTIESCCETDSSGNPTLCGFESQACIDYSDKNNSCGNTINSKCNY